MTLHDRGGSLIGMGCRPHFIAIGREKVGRRLEGVWWMGIEGKVLQVEDTKALAAIGKVVCH